ncbi:hypothetical protein VNI00_005175 [Paramarasmius palmivorus]|uniref:Mediator of RNA polymerase II transcription subunit 25 von Willebrand factor type A domain-containing protein n=1 Tax=Paramarasmius palmivorus TaxID=297713 RepID=A0AAW0DIP1_9AGAR
MGAEQENDKRPDNSLMDTAPAAPDSVAVVLVFDTSFTLQSLWPAILQVYISSILKRLSEGRQTRLGFITYSLPEMCSYSPIVCKQFLGELMLMAKPLREKSVELGIGSSSDGGKRGMAALEGLAAAIEMVDMFNSSLNQNTGRSLISHIIHITASSPNDAVHPQWNDLETLDDLTWESLPAELSSRNIHLSTITLKGEIPVYSTLHAAIPSSNSTPWFPLIVPTHKVYLSGHLTSLAKRPAEQLPPDQVPESKRPRLSETPSNTTSSPKKTAPTPNISNAILPSPPTKDGNPTPTPTLNPTTLPPNPNPNPPSNLPPNQNTNIPRPQGPLPMQTVQAMVQKMAYTEQSIKKLEAARMEALSAGDHQKAERVNTEMGKMRQHANQLKGILQQQIAFHRQAGGGIAGNAGNGPNPSEQGQGPGEIPGTSRNPSERQPPQTQPPQQVPPPAAAVPVPPPQTQPPPPAQLQQLPPEAPPNPNQQHLAAQMQKIIEQEKSGRAQPPQPQPPQPQPPQSQPSLQPQPQPPIRNRSPMMPPQPQNPPPMSAVPGPVNPDQNQVPVWNGTFVWPPDAVNGMREMRFRAAVYSLGTPNESRSQTWPSTISLKAGPGPVTMPDVQSWIQSHKEGMFLGKLQPVPEQGPNMLQIFAQILVTKRTASLFYFCAEFSVDGIMQYVIAQWTTPTGQQRPTAVIIPMSPIGLLGAFFPVDGIVDLPKSSMPPNMGQPSQPPFAPPMQQPPPIQPPNSLGQTPSQHPLQPPPQLLPQQQPQPQQPTQPFHPSITQELIMRIRNNPNAQERVIHAHGVIMRLQQLQGRNMTTTDAHKLLAAMNVAPQQLALVQRAMAARNANAGMGGAGMPGGMRPPIPGQPDFGGGGPAGGGMPPPGMMGGGAGGFNPTAMMNSAGRGGMMGAGFAGMNGAMGGFAGQGNMNNISMEMMQSFAQRNMSGDGGPGGNGMG